MLQLYQRKREYTLHERTVYWCPFVQHRSSVPIQIHQTRKRIVMSTLTNRTLLRLHLEAVWSIYLPPIEQDEIELLPESVQPGWKLCAAEMAGERILIWRKDIARE